MSKLLFTLTIIGAVALSYGLLNMAQNKPKLGNAQYEQEVLDAWNLWKQSQKKEYLGASEHDYRLGIFNTNYQLIKESNAKPEHTFELGLNKFADMSAEEFQKVYLGYLQDDSREYDNGDKTILENVPESIDWNDDSHRAVTDVKDQGQCGSCWAFSTIGSLEGLHRLTQTTLQTFSEQQLVDCARGSIWPLEMPNNGCNGGNMAGAMQYTAHKGNMLQCAYNYTAKQGSCQYNEKQAVKINSSYKHIFFGCNSCLKSAVSQQPVSVGVDGSAIQHYKSGIFNGSCTIMVNHGVLAVGYDTENGQKYWKIKNSWGKAWGESGFYRLPRTDSLGFGACGIATRANYPTA